MIFTDDEIASLCCANQTCDDEDNLRDCVERITLELEGYDQQEIDGVKIAITKYAGYTIVAHAFVAEGIRGEGRLRKVMESLPKPVIYQPYIKQYGSLIGKPIPKIVRLSYPSLFWSLPDTIMSYFLFGSKRQKYVFPTLFVGDTGDQYIAHSTFGVERDLQAYYYAKRNGLI